MGRKTWLAVATLIAVAGIGFVGWKVIGEPTATEAAAPLELAPGGDEATQALAQPVLDRPPEPVEDAPLPVAQEPETTRSSATAEEVELADAIWIEGRVLFPAGTPPDENVTITALGRKFDSIKHHRVTIERNGSFRVGFHSKTKKGRLVLAGRYVYSPSVRIDLREDQDEIVIEPKLGGRLTVVLRPPADLRPDDPVPEEVGLQAYTENNHRKRGQEKLEEDAFTFDLGGLVPDAGYRLHSSPEGWKSIQHKGVEVRAGEHQHVELTASLGAQVRGRVVDANGDVISGVSLSVESQREAGSQSWSDRSLERKSEDDGSFALLGIAPGTLELRAALKGYVTLEQDLGTLADRGRLDDLVVTLDRGLTLAGLVVWPDGTKADGAQLVIEDSSQLHGFWRNKRPTAKTETGGTFEISGLKKGPFTIKVSAIRPPPEGRRETLHEKRARKAAQWIALAERVQGDRQDLVLTLSPGGAVRGTVVDQDGVPVDTFKVHAKPVAARGTPGRTQSFRESGGSFTFEGLGEGEWSFVASTKEHAPGTDVLVSVPDESTPVTLVVQKGIRISGRVTTSNGEPLEGARLSAYERSGNRNQNFDRSWSTGSTKTDEDGTFTFKHLAPGKIQVSVEKSGYAKYSESDFTLTAGEQLEGVAFALSVGGKIVGRLHPKPGVDVAGQNILVRNRGHSYREQSKTDEDGRFTFAHVPPGTIIVQMGNRQVQEEVTLADGQTVEVVLGLPQEGSIRLFGTVTRDGRAVVDVSVTAIQSGRMLEATTDATGRYEMLVAEAGEYNVYVRDAGVGRSETVEVLEAAEHRHDFTLPQGRIQGHVLAPDGTPAVGTYVHASSTNGSGGSGYVQAGDDGEFRLEGLPGGDYKLAAQRWHAYSAGQPYVSPALELELTDGGTLEGVVLQLTEPCRIEGRVTTAAGKPAVNASVTVMSEELGQQQVRTDGAGHYRAFGAPGTWTALARSDTQASRKSAPVQIEAGDAAKIDLALEPGTIIEVEIANTPGQVWVTLTDEDGRHHPNRSRGRQTATAEGGGYLFGPVPPGTYNIKVHGNGQKAEPLERVTVNGEPKRKVVLELETEEPEPGLVGEGDEGDG
jgi:hypothetical protein